MKVDIKYQAKDGLVLGDGVQTDSVVPTAATAYKRGDLLVVGANNAATHSTDGTDWHVVCLEDVTADQADKAIAAGFEIPVYTQGELNVMAVTLNGVALNKEQRKAARGRANSATSIELRMPFGVEDK